MQLTARLHRGDAFAMLKLRFISQSFLVLALLLGQHGSALHSLRHAFAEQAQQQKKHLPDGECEQCISYAQFSGTLNSAKLTFDFRSTFSGVFAAPALLFFSRQSPTAVARGPPSFQRSV